MLCLLLQVAVGSDPRISAPLLGPAVLAGLLSAGAKAVDVGLATTPAMFYGIVAPGELMHAAHIIRLSRGVTLFALTASASSVTAVSMFRRLATPDAKAMATSQERTVTCVATCVLCWCCCCYCCLRFVCERLHHADSLTHALPEQWHEVLHC